MSLAALLDFEGEAPPALIPSAFLVSFIPALGFASLPVCPLHPSSNQGDRFYDDLCADLIRIFASLPAYPSLPTACDVFSSFDDLRKVGNLCVSGCGVAIFHYSPAFISTPRAKG